MPHPRSAENSPDGTKNLSIKAAILSTNRDRVKGAADRLRASISEVRSARVEHVVEGRRSRHRRVASGGRSCSSTPAYLY